MENFILYHSEIKNIKKTVFFNYSQSLPFTHIKYHDNFTRNTNITNPKTISNIKSTLDLCVKKKIYKNRSHQKSGKLF